MFTDAYWFQQRRVGPDNLIHHYGTEVGTSDRARNTALIHNLKKNNRLYTGTELKGSKVNEPRATPTQTSSKQVGTPKSKSACSITHAMLHGLTFGKLTPSPTLLSSNPGTNVTTFTLPFNTGVSAAHLSVPTSSGFSPCGRGGCIRLKYLPRSLDVIVIGRAETSGIGLIEALKKGSCASGSVTLNKVVPSAPGL